MQTKACISILLCVLMPSVNGFLSPHRTVGIASSAYVLKPDKITSTALYLADNGKERSKKKGGGLEPGVRDKLLAESIAPWRTLRKFLYVAAGSGALLGGLITLTGAIAALNGARADLDMNTEYLNLAIDFGAVAVFAVAFKFDSDKGAELDVSVKEKVEKKKEQKKVAKSMRAREAKLKDLMLTIQASTDGDTMDAKVGDLQTGAKQHMIIVIGPKKACRDALVGANLNKMNFGKSNILVVPYDTGIDAEKQAAGFGERPAYETQPYVARPIGEGWEAYVEAEMNDAVKQSGEKCKEEGIAIVVEKSGKVIRRGVGTIPWRIMVNELTGKVEGESLPMI